MRPLLLLLFVSLLLPGLAGAQTREDQARDDLNYGDSRRQVLSEGGDIWYGAGATIGFSANNFSSSFRIGLAPMVGYKLNNFVSVGPRVSIIYNHFRYDPGYSIPEFKEGYWTWAAGMFARAKVYRGFFVHAEYSLQSEVDFVPDNNSASGISTNRYTQAIPFLGAGLSQGGGPGSTGFEILLLFRLSQRERLNDAPYEIRSGINYNF